MVRYTLTLSLLLCLPPITRAADDLAVLKAPGPNQVVPSRTLYEVLREQSRARLHARREAVATLKTADDVTRYAAEARAKLRASLGELPEKTPLNARTVARDRRDGYTVERVVYESRPGHHVTALLYLPDGPPPFPGVLVPCGHEAQGKGGDTYQRVSISLARNGLAVLCYDPIGQGERIQLFDPSGKLAFSGSTAEHTGLGLGALLVGRSAAGYRVWDGIRSLDYLASRPEVDPKHLACTGNSGGGTLTSYLMALDDRVAVAAPCCFITSLDRLYATIGPQDAEQNLTGQVAEGIDHADFITMRAPKPTLLCVGTRDFFDIQGSWETFREVKALYGRLGFGERVDLFESDEPHGFTRPRREAAVRWMRRWLLGKDDAITEVESSLPDEMAIRCTATGQVLSTFRGRSAFDLNAERAAELMKSRALTKRPKPELLERVRRLIGVPAGRRDAKTVISEPFQRGSMACRRLSIAVESGVEITGVVFEPSEAKRLVVVVGGDRREMAGPGGLVERETSRGSRVALVDVRGTGETAPSGPTSKALGAFGADWQEAFLALSLNRPLLGQRVVDVLAWLDVLGAKGDVQLIGIGPAAPLALHAAALDPRVSGLTLEKGVVSWSAVASMPSTTGELGNVVPNALATYDLPDLAATLAPRPLSIQDAVDPVGRPVGQAALDEAYSTARGAYAAASAADRLQLRARP